MSRHAGPLFGADKHAGMTAFEKPSNPVFQPDEYLSTNCCVGCVHGGLCDVCGGQNMPGMCYCGEEPPGFGGGGGGGGGGSGSECECECNDDDDDCDCEPQVTILSADFSSDEVSILLDPESASGSLELALLGDKQTHVISTSDRDGGTYALPFEVANIPTGQFNQVRATWTVEDEDYEGTRDYSFHVLGTYRHSQYNTPTESACSASSTASYVTTSRCAFAKTTFRGQFVSQANLNGSGNSIDHGTIAREAYCIGRPDAPDDAAKRSFRTGHKVAGACGGNTAPVNDNTVAVLPSHGDLTCGDSVYIVGHGVKIVTDICPSCAEAQLDNYTTTPACSGVTDLGNFKTIKLF